MKTSPPTRPNSAEAARGGQPAVAVSTEVLIARAGMGQEGVVDLQLSVAEGNMGVGLATGRPPAGARVTSPPGTRAISVAPRNRPRIVTTAREAGTLPSLGSWLTGNAESGERGLSEQDAAQIVDSTDADGVGEQAAQQQAGPAASIAKSGRTR